MLEADREEISLRKKIVRSVREEKPTNQSEKSLKSSSSSVDEQRDDGDRFFLLRTEKNHFESKRFSMRFFF